MDMSPPVARQEAREGLHLAKAQAQARGNDAPGGEVLAVKVIGIKELEDVLTRSPAPCSAVAKCALIMDRSERAAVYFRCIPLPKKLPSGPGG